MREWRDQPTKKQAVRAKLKVLREFGVVDDDNEYSIKEQLNDAIAANPNRDYEIVLDQVAQKMIMKKLS